MHTGHALIIEDELVVGLDLQAMLAGMGFSSFAFASTANQALEQARLKAPDLITVDLGLLSGDGVTAVMSILEEGFGASVVFVSGDQQGLDRLRGWARVEKPVSPAALAQAVDRAMVRGERAAAG
jgi:CheY-like chemotaxis protein